MKDNLHNMTWKSSTMSLKSSKSLLDQLFRSFNNFIKGAAKNLSAKTEPEFTCSICCIRFAASCSCDGLRRRPRGWHKAHLILLEMQRDSAKRMHRNIRSLFSCLHIILKSSSPIHSPEYWARQMEPDSWHESTAQQHMEFSQLNYVHTHTHNSRVSFQSDDGELWN